MKTRTPDKSKHLIENTKSKLFEAIVPTYILNESYYFIEWNKAFEELVAKPLNLELGMHAVEFVDRCEGKKEILERSARVFSVGNTPASDHEPLTLKSRTYGNITFHKLATRVHHPNNDQITWIVSLNISHADKLDALFADLMKIIERSVT